MKFIHNIQRVIFNNYASLAVDFQENVANEVKDE